MTKEEKQLLLKDLCGRLPYGIKVKVDTDELYGDFKLNGMVYGVCKIEGISFEIDDVKPYLRAMSSMTEEEFIYFMGIRGRNLPSHEILMMMKEALSLPNLLSIVIQLGMYYKKIDWLNKNMFDYRGLIGKGLALEAPGGMYKEEEK